jgi:hypothetical protein
LIVASFKGLEALIRHERRKRHEIINEIISIEGVSEYHGLAEFFVS